MTVIIRLPQFMKSRASAEARAPRPKDRERSLRDKRRDTGSSPARGKTKRSVPMAERLFYLLCISLPFVTLVQTVLARAGEFTAFESPASRGSFETTTFLAGPHWGYQVPFAVENKVAIEKLIQCESGGRNISRPDSDGLISDGILQFHRGPADTYAGGTWEDFSRDSGITGSPRDPADAIRMADWAISHGLGPHWTCWQLENLSAAR
jgi:hypothetical protein